MNTGARIPLSRLLPRSVAALVLALVGLNLADALLTLQHVGRGAIEVIPLMELLLRQGPLPFLLGKHFLVAAAVMVMAAHSARRLAVDGLRFVLLPAYGMVATYQVALLCMPPL